MLNMPSTDAHALTHPIERLLELSRLKLWQFALLQPFLAYKSLGMQRCGPINGAATVDPETKLSECLG
jgi:hypothetical protein